MSKKRKYIFIIITFSVIFSLILLLILYPKNDNIRKLRNIQSGQDDLNIILISIDTCRADHLSPYGYNIETPTIQQLADEGTLFLNARTPIPLTLPGHSSMLTGNNPPRIAVHDNYHYFIDEGNITLTEILKENGYKTSAFIGGLPLDEMFGFNQGFDYYWDDMVRKSFDEFGNLTNVSAEDVIDQSITWLETNKDSKYFMFIHLYDPHFPYLPPPPNDKLYENRPYDGELAYVDKCLKSLIDWLKLHDQQSDTLIILTSDHGEAFGEHYELEHGYFIYNTTLTVPLIFWSPDLIPEDKRIDGKVSIIDITPTVLDILNMDDEFIYEGESLLPSIIKDRSIKEKPIYYESFKCFYSLGYSKLFGLEMGDWKYILAPEPELYDLKTDPEEENNIYNKHPEVVSELDEILNNLLMNSLDGSNVNEAKADIDKNTKDALVGLGYISSGNNISEKLDIDPKEMAEFFYKTNKIWLSIITHDGLYGEEDLKELFQSAPDEPNLLSLMGNYSISMGRVEEGIQYLEKATKIAPDLFNIKLQLAQTYFSNGDYEKSEILLLEIIRNEEHSDLLTIRDAYLYLASIHKIEGTYLDKAIHYVEKSIDLDKNNPDAYYLGVLIAFEDLRDFELAQFYGERFLSIEHSGSRAKKIETYLADMSK